MKKNLLLQVLLGLVLTVPHSVQAQDEESNESTLKRVEEINLTVERHSKELTESRQKQASIEQSYSQLRQEIKGIQQKEAVLAKDLEISKRKISDLNKEIELASDQIESIERRFRMRIRVLYTSKTDSFMENLLLVSDQASFKKNAYFMSRIREFDKTLLAELFMLKTEKQDGIAAYETELTNKAKLQEQILNQSKVLNAKIQEQDKLLKQSKAQRDKLEKTISVLKAQSLRIETVITSLTGKAEQQTKKTAAKTDKKAESSSPLEAFEGQGLEPLKGQLALPVGGQLIIASGENNFNKMVGTKGLTFSVACGASVAAVADGQVMFNSTMPGLDRIVILDHGQRSYSLYGKLGESSVKLKQSVAAGESIGITGGATPEKCEFYFEIRKNGLTQQTRQYLKGL